MIREIREIHNPAIIKELKHFPNQAFIWEIIEKNKIGKIFSLSNEAILILENCKDPFVFIAGSLNTHSIQEVISLIENFEYPMIYCNPRYHNLFLDKGWDFNLRAELKFNGLLQPKLIDRNLNIQPIKTIQLFKQCYWRKEKSDLYVSDENFLKYGTGYVLCNEAQEILSEAYLNQANGYAEISIVTCPTHQRKGYASQLILDLLHKCKEAELIPIWSCNLDNKASLNIALKLGFYISNYYVQIVPEVGNILGPKLEKWLKT